MTEAGADLPVEGDPNVALMHDDVYVSAFEIKEKVKSVRWMDDNTPVEYSHENESVTVRTVPYTYGRNLVVRVALIECE